VLANAILPAIARPAAIETKLASAIPTLKSLSGNFTPNAFVFSESVVSPPTQTTFGFSPPNFTKVSPYADLISEIRTLLLKEYDNIIYPRLLYCF